MKTKKNKKLLMLLFIIVVILLISFRIYSVNKNTYLYKTYRQNITAGDTIIVEDIEITFTEASKPVVKKSEEYEGRTSVVTMLPIEITKNHNRSLSTKRIFGIYESYEDFQNIPGIHFKDTKTDNNLMQSIDRLKKGESLKAKIQFEMIQGEFFDYYEDYNAKKRAYIIVAGPPSKKGLPLYYYKIQQKS